MDRSSQLYSRRAALRHGALLAGRAGVGLAALQSMASMAGLASAAATPTAGALDALVAAHLAFGFRLYDALALADTSGGNLIVSPLSVALALSMTYNGARGSTRTAMARTLGLGALSTGDLNAASAALLARLRTLDPAIELNVAGSLWLRQGLAVQPAFRQELRRSYDAGVTPLDFADPRAPAAINAWVNRQTHGLIPSLVSRIPAQMILYLINTLYFKGPWSDPFEPSATTPQPFTLSSGQSRVVPMMSRRGAYRHYKGPDYEAICLPYGAGKVAMYILLPAATRSLKDLQGQLTASSWTALLPALKSAMGTIVLPRFSVTYGASLRAALAALGMGVAFDPRRADLSAMVSPRSQRTYIDDVQHKTVLKVREEGTLAAAATSVGVGATAMPVSTFTMTVNRPFFCVIREETLGIPLFIGAVADPQP